MLLRRCLLILCAALSLLAPAAYAQTEARLALLIGNADYKSAPLVNPVNDVRLMEAVLKEVGFTVIKAENASIREMRRLVRDFGDRLKASGGVGLFYFAGHGVQVRGENFLVSTDSDIRNEDEVADDAVNASVILEKMQGAGNRMNLIILDACRNNPFAVKSRTASAGLATMNAPSGSLVAYATAPGSVAFDGSGSNGLYTKHLAEVIRQPGLPVEEVFKQVRASVRKESNNQQTPWENTALEGQFYFRAPVQGAGAPPGSGATTARPSGPDLLAVDLAFWESVKGSQRSSELQAYLTQFPNGIFATLARVRLEEMKLATLSPRPSAVAPVAAPAPRPLAAGVIGTLVLTDGFTGVNRSVDVAVKEEDAQKTAYSSGDVIARDGRVLQVMVGEVVLRLVSGALWTIPLKAGTSGEARIERADVSYSAEGTLKWRAVAANDGKVRIEADVLYKVVVPTNNPQAAYPNGKWLATFSDGNPLPESSSTAIRSFGSMASVSNMVSTEMKLR